MHACDARLVISSACALWAAGAVNGLLLHFTDDVVFAVHARPNAPSLLGEGLGRVLLERRLEAVLDQIEVQSFKVYRQSFTTDGFWYFSRASFRYRHRVSRLIIEGTMRQKWGLVGARIAHFEIFHDSDRMRAFYDVAGLAACNA
jgi:hypothetical protein